MKILNPVFGDVCGWSGPVGDEPDRPDGEDDADSRLFQDQKEETLGDPQKANQGPKGGWTGDVVCLVALGLSVMFKVFEDIEHH